MTCNTKSGKSETKTAVALKKKKNLHELFYIKLEIILSATDVSNLDTLVPGVTGKISSLRRTAKFIMLCRTTKKMKTRESLKLLNKAVPQLTIRRSISVVDNKGERTKTMQAKTLNMLTRTLHGMDYNT